MIEVSLIVVEADCPCAVTVSVSLPSVVESVTRGTEIVACPLLPTLTDPERLPPVMSEAETPEIEYEIDVPAATLVVESVKVAVDPSLKDAEEALTV